MLKKLVALIVILLSIFNLNIAMANASDEDNDSRPLIKVAFIKQANYCDFDKGYSGYTCEYIEKIARMNNWRIQYVSFITGDYEQDYKDALTALNKKQIDIIGGITKDKVSDDLVIGDNYYGNVYNLLQICSNNNNISINNYMYKNPFKVAIIDNEGLALNECENFLKSYNINYTFIQCEDEKTQRNLVKMGRADAAITNTLHQFSECVTVEKFAPSPIYFAGSKYSAGIVKKIDDAIDKINMTEYYYQSDLNDKYFNLQNEKFFLTTREEKYVLNKKTIKVLVLSEYPPYAYVDNKGKLSGVAINILNNFVKATGFKVEYTSVLSNRNYVTLENLDYNNYDIIVGPPYSKKFMNKYNLLCSTIYMKDRYKLVVNDESIINNLQKYNVAMIKGISDEEDYNYKFAYYYQTLKDCLLAVNQKVADYAYISQYSMDYYNMKNKYDNIKTVALNTVQEYMGYYVNNSNDVVLLSLLNKYIYSLDDYTVQSLLTKEFVNNDDIVLKKALKDNPIVMTTFIILCLLLLFSVAFIISYSIINNKKNAALQEALNAKSNFLARVSHDMRTPMNGIIGMLYLLKKESNLTQIKASLDTMEVSANYLLELINDTLDISKAESANLKLKIEVVDIKNFWNNVQKTIDINANNKNIKMCYKIDLQGVEYAYFDSIRVKQILTNLIFNAIKFTPDNGEVDVNINISKQTCNKCIAQLIVKDNGIGISKEFMPKLFLPFEQEYNTNTTKYDGTGLGLSIVKNLVDLMHGHIIVDSEKGKGTTFEVILPLNIAENNGKKENMQNDEEKFANRRILLCEDNPINIKIATKLLEEKGVLVESATNGEIGVQMFTNVEKNYYDAILMDIRMPVMDGLQATKTIRAMNKDGAKNIPIIAVTANSYDDDIKLAQDVGVNYYLAKPIKPEELYKLLREIFK